MAIFLLQESPDACPQAIAALDDAHGGGRTETRSPRSPG